MKWKLPWHEPSEWPSVRWVTRKNAEDKIAALVDAVEKLRTCPYEPDCSSYDELVRVIFEKNKSLLPQESLLDKLMGKKS